MINQVISEPLPNVSEFPILDDNPMFDDTFEWGAASPLELGTTILKMARVNNFSLYDIRVVMLVFLLNLARKFMYDKL